MKLAVMSKNVKFKDIKNGLIGDKSGKGAELLTFASFSYRGQNLKTLNGHLKGNAFKTRSKI